MNDAIGFEALNDAIVDAERVCTSVLCDVVSQNLLFIFGQSLQSLCYAKIAAPPEPPTPCETNEIVSSGHYEKRDADNKSKPKHRAIVLCKLKNSD